MCSAGWGAARGGTAWLRTFDKYAIPLARAAADDILGYNFGHNGDFAVIKPAE